jgi:hypothetical protein
VRSVGREGNWWGGETYGVCDVQVIRDKGFQPGLSVVDGGGIAGGAEGYVQYQYYIRLSCI